MTLTDADARAAIRDDTDRTLFVNAGAGSGKTSALVERVTTLVLRDGISLSKLAAVTFTEKAGAELRDRLRAVFEQRWRERGADAELAAQALDDLDSAAIGTLHAFAQRLLSEHPIEAGLPPVIEVLDEVGSSVAFDEQWSEVLAALLDDDGIARPLLLGMACGVKLDHLRALALLLGRDWDLIADRVLGTDSPPLVIPDLDAFADELSAFLECRASCTNPADKLLVRLDELARLRDLLRDAPDLESKLAVLPRFADVKVGNYGQKGSWRLSVGEIRSEAGALVQRAELLLQHIGGACLRALTAWLARRVVDAAEDRRREGRLQFHDLLVLARDVLRRDAHVRAAAGADYQYLLLDEFQDTDPIQIEIAARICGGAAADADRWTDIAIPDGRLFVVGDAKQSIYRFRRANIALYLEAEQHIGTATELTTNFRTVTPVLDWINAVFGSLITAEPGAQPPYVPLDGHRTGPPAGPFGGGSSDPGPVVTVLGAEGHPDKPNAATLREREAADVAAVVRQALDEGWQVFDRGHWRPARPEDIAVLVPARTSLPFLEAALDDAQIPYRAEASSLVYQSSEVRSLLACARALADTSDALALVTALRSPLFGCGDDDLWRWRRAGGVFAIHAEVEGDVSDGPVGRALAYLRHVHARARWLSPSEVLAAVVIDRRMWEVAATGSRARDSWRRLRFVIDQARAWTEVSHGGLRAYLAWAARQGQELGRVAEAVLPETDAHAVRVLTIHAAKGLEFPIVVLSGMTAQRRSSSGVSLLWPPGGGFEVRLRKNVQTELYDEAVPIDEQMDERERRRLLYVAATRSRDHLVVSLHRSEVGNAGTAATSLAQAGAATAAGAVAFAGYEFVTDDQAVPTAEPPPPFAEWLAAVAPARAASRVTPTVSASGLEGTEPEVVLAATPDPPGQAKGARDLDLPPWSKGRYGSAVGRAVHGVLQVIDLATGAGLDAAVAAQAIGEGVTGQQQLVRDLVRSALASPVVQLAASREHWRETYVGYPRADGVVVEGFIDLVYRADDGSLAVVDYKTDTIPAGAVASRVAYYAPQMTAYRDALASATQMPVTTTLLFLHPEGAAVARRV